MSAWKVPMPRAEADKGEAHFVFAMKGGGQRVELEGQLPMADVVKALHDLIKAKSNKQRAAKESSNKPPKPITSCQAGRDGDCIHPLCPQNRDNEPNKTGRHCPLDNQEDELT